MSASSSSTKKRMERMELKQHFWRKSFELGSERWKARSGLMIELFSGWAGIVRERLINVAIILVVGVIIISLAPHHLLWTWKAITAPLKPELATGPEMYVPSIFYIKAVKPQYHDERFYSVKEEEWGTDSRYSNWYTTPEEAYEELTSSRSLILIGTATWHLAVVLIATR